VGLATVAAVLSLALPDAGAQAYDPSRDPKAQAAAAAIEATRRRADAAATELSRVSQDLEQRTAELEQAQADRDAAAAQLAALRSGATGLALSRYVRDASSLDAFLTVDGDPTLTVRATTYLQLATGQTRDAEGELKAAREDLEVRSRQLAAEQADLEATQDALRGAQERFQRELVSLQQAEAKRQAEAAVAAEVARRRAAEARAAAAAQAAAAAKEAAARRASTGGSSGGSSGPGSAGPAALTASSSVGSGAGIVCPVQGATAFGDTFGAPRAGRWGHEGVDMMGSTGQAIVAAESGSIRFTQSRSGGNQIWLYGDSGTRYFYAHLSSYAGGPRRVSAGEVIGGMGMTGQTGAVHLHFEIRPGGGSAINPYPAVRAVC
jgi:murein DD-endopeptidase MepM/ murein hydrolase activator NlpD